ncbi:MAG: thymidylate synthase [Candidatus Saccharibacteria bacterium]
MGSFVSTIISSDSVDGLVQQGIQHILEYGERFEARAGKGLQAYGTTYVLESPLARVHTLRAPSSVQYLARELQAYFIGSQDVEDGLAQAAPFWKSLCDADGKINSNYGYYTFRQRTESGGSQLDWVRTCFVENRDTRKALITINGIEHKTDTKDFPCTVGMQFFLRGNTMNCEVASRSTDVITGLPYDMGFFSLVNELVTGLVAHDLGEDLEVGYTAMRTNFTQIYDKTAAKSQQVLKHTADKAHQLMPPITNAVDTLADIMHITKRPPTTDVVRWVVKMAELPIRYGKS